MPKRIISLVFLSACLISTSLSATETQPSEGHALMALIKQAEDRVASNPLDLRQRLKAASLYIEWGEQVPARRTFAFGRAETLLDSVLSVRPFSFNALLLLTRLYSLKNDPSLYLDNAERFVSFYPNNLTALWIKVDASKVAGKNYAATLEHILDIDPVNKRAAKELSLLETRPVKKETVPKRPPEKAAKKSKSHTPPSKPKPAATPPPPPSTSQSTGAKAVESGYRFPPGKQYKYIVQVSFGDKDLVDGSLLIGLKKAGKLDVTPAGEFPPGVTGTFEVELSADGKISFSSAVQEKSFLSLVLPLLPKQSFSSWQGTYSLSSTLFVPDHKPVSGNTEFNLSLSPQKEPQAELVFEGKSSEYTAKGEGFYVFDKDGYIPKSGELSFFLTDKSGSEIEYTVTFERQ